MKKAIIIGATSGIGRELSLVLANNNYKVGITGRRTELLSQLLLEKPNSFISNFIDITDTDLTTSELNKLISKLGGLDLIVISSGVGEINKKLDFEIGNETIRTNVMGFTAISNWAFNYFEKQKSGHLVAISSIAGLRGSKDAPSYNASKAYQINYLEGLRQKAQSLKTNIIVTDIRPGLVNTDMAKGEGLFWIMPVEKTVKQIYKAIIMKKNIVYVTKRWGIIARILKIIPNFLYARM